MGVWVQGEEAAGYQRAGTKKPCQGLFPSPGIRNGGPKFKHGLSHLEQAGEADLGAHIWAEGSGKPPIPRKGSGRAGSLPLTPLHLAALLPSCQAGTPKGARDTQHKLAHTSRFLS